MTKERLQPPHWWARVNLSEEEERRPRYVITLEMHVFIVMPFQLHQIKRKEFSNTWFFGCCLYREHYILELCLKDDSVWVCLKMVVSVNGCGHSLPSFADGLYHLYVHWLPLPGNLSWSFARYVQCQKGSHCSIGYLPCRLSRIGEQSDRLWVTSGVRALANKPFGTFAASGILWDGTCWSACLEARGVVGMFSSTRLIFDISKIRCGIFDDPATMACSSTLELPDLS